MPAADLALAKDYITGSFPREIETPQQVAGEVATNRLLRLPQEYLEKYRTRVAAVDAKEVQRVAQKHLKPEQALVVVVGDASQIYDKVAALRVRLGHYGPALLLTPLASAESALSLSGPRPMVNERPKRATSD